LAVVPGNTVKMLVRAALLFVCIHAAAADGPYSFIKQLGGPGRQLVYAVDVDRDGNIAIAGALEGSADFGGGPLTSAGHADMFVAKFNARGEHLWSKRFGSRDYEVFVQVRFDSQGNLVLAGVAEGAVDFGGGILSPDDPYDICLVKFGPDGSHLWSRRIGSKGSQSVGGMALDGSDNIVLAGTYSGVLDFGLGPLPPGNFGSIYLAKLTSSGMPVFSRAFSSVTGTDAQATRVAVSPAGRIAMSGPFLGKLDIGGHVLTAPAPYGFDSYVAEFEADGTPSWAQAYEIVQPALAFASGDDLVMSAGTAILQSVTIGSDVFSGQGVVMARFDTAGSPRWARFFPGGFGNASGSTPLMVDAAGGITWLGTGSSGDLGNGPLPMHKDDYDIVIARLDSEARLISATVHGDKRPQFLASVARGPAGEIVVAGSFSGAIAFGDVTLYDSDGSGLTEGSEQTEEDMFLVGIKGPAPRRRSSRPSS